jgi:hypothetical protein
MPVSIWREAQEKADRLGISRNAAIGIAVWEWTRRSPT